MNFNSLILLVGDLLKLRLLLDVSIFITIEEEKEEQKSTLHLFLKDIT